MKIKQRRNPHNGRFTEDRRLYAMFLGGMFAILIVVLGVNNIYYAIRSLSRFDRVFLVENTFAEETITNLSWQEEVMLMLKREGIDTKLASKIIQCESSWNPSAFNKNKDSSSDRGLWQLSNKYYSKVLDRCAYDAVCSTGEAIKIIKSEGFKPWVCYSHKLIK